MYSGQTELKIGIPYHNPQSSSEMSSLFYSILCSSCSRPVVAVLQSLNVLSGKNPKRSMDLYTDCLMLSSSTRDTVTRMIHTDISILR